MSKFILPPNTQLTILQNTINSKAITILHLTTINTVISLPFLGLPKLLINKFNRLEFFISNDLKTQLLNILANVLNPNIWKIKFNSKGYKVKKYKCVPGVKLTVGKAHKPIILFKALQILKPTKYNFLILVRNNASIQHLLKEIIDVRPINIFTKRGLRVSKMLLVKKSGKKTTYV